MSEYNKCDFSPEPAFSMRCSQSAKTLLTISSGALQGLNVCCDTLKLFLSKLVNTTAGSASSITSFQDFSQLCQSKSDPKRPLHDKHSFHGARGIDPVARLCPRGPWENPDLFIVSNRVRTHTVALARTSGTKSFGTAVLHHVKYQPWNAFESQGIVDVVLKTLSGTADDV